MLQFGNFAILKLATYFITWRFVDHEFFSTCKTAMLEHSPTNQVLVYVHNSLLIVYNDSIQYIHHFSFIKH